VTERRFDPALYARGKRVADWSQAIRHPATGDLVRRHVESQLSKDGKWIEGTMTYKTVYANGRGTLVDCPFEAPVMRVEDYVARFDEAGFVTRVCVGYKEQADDGKDPILCFVCERKRAEGVR